MAAAAVALLVLAGAVAIGVAIGNRNDQSADQTAGGVVEFEATIRATSGDGTAKVTGLRSPSGLVVKIRADGLEPPPKGGYYEVFFLAPGNSARRPNQVSAGTFRPDANGESDVSLHTAVDPSTFPTVVVTAEPGDGNPALNGLPVLRGSVQIRN